MLKQLKKWKKIIALSTMVTLGAGVSGCGPSINNENDLNSAIIYMNDGDYKLGVACYNALLMFNANLGITIKDFDNNVLAKNILTNVDSYDENKVIMEQGYSLTNLVDVDKLTTENKDFLKEKSEERDAWLDANIKYKVHDEYKVGDSFCTRDLKLYKTNNTVTGGEFQYIGYDYGYNEENPSGVFDIITLDTHPLDALSNVEIINLRNYFSDNTVLNRNEIIEFLNEYKNTNKKILSK